MKLGLFATILCSMLLAFVGAIAYFSATEGLIGRFDRIGSVHRAAVEEFAQTTLTSRGYLAEVVGGEVAGRPEVAKALLLAPSPAAKGTLDQAAGDIRSKVACDSVTFVPASDVVINVPLYELKMTDRGLLATLSLPIRLASDTVGALVMEFKLNEQLAADVQTATSTPVRFSFNSPSTVVLKWGNQSRYSLYLDVDPGAVETIQGQVWTNVILIGAVSLFLLVTMLLAMLYWGFWRGFRDVIANIETGSRALENNRVLVVPRQRYRIKEVSLLSDAFARYSDRLRDFKDRLLQKNRTEVMGEKAAQLAHDINGPLTALEMALDLDLTASYSDPQKAAIRRLFDRLRGVVSTMREQGRSFSAEPLKDSNLVDLVEAVVLEKRAQHPKGITIDLTIPKNELLFATLQRLEFQRAISNVITNSVEAMDSEGHIDVTVGKDGQKVFVEIADRGRGIPPELLPFLGERGVSLGKAHGSGLGLWHANQMAEACGGVVHVDSRLGGGTRVRLVFLAAVAEGAEESRGDAS